MAYGFSPPSTEGNAIAALIVAVMTLAIIGVVIGLVAWHGGTGVSTVS